MLNATTRDYLGNQPIDELDGVSHRTGLYEVHGATINLGIKGTS